MVFMPTDSNADKPLNNVAIICIKYYVEVVSKEIVLIGYRGDTYCKADKYCDKTSAVNVE